MRSKSEKRQNVPSDDWFITVQEGLIKEKLKMINFLNQDIAFNLQLKERIDNNKTVWMIEHIIQDARKYIRILGDEIKFNRGLIDERRKELRLRNHLIDRDESGAGHAEGSGLKDNEQPSIIG